MRNGARETLGYVRVMNNTTSSPKGENPYLHRSVFFIVLDEQRKGVKEIDLFMLIINTVDLDQPLIQGIDIFTNTHIRHVNNMQ